MGGGATRCCSERRCFRSYWTPRMTLALGQLRAPTRPAWPRFPRTTRPCWKTDRKSTRLNSSHGYISYAVFCLKKQKSTHARTSTYPKAVLQVVVAVEGSAL